VKATIVVVEDDPDQREQLVGFVGSLGHAVRAAADLDGGRKAIEAGGVDVVVTDLRVGAENGVDLLKWSKARHPLADFVVVTAYGSVETAVDAMRCGAEDFLMKPIDLDVLEQRLARILEKRRLAHEVRTLKAQIAERLEVAGVVAESPAMQDVLKLAKRVAATDSTVLVVGESGTGKEVVADLIHAWSARRDGPFVRINCGALPETLLETELFGHVRGAFTGAERDRKGLFLEATGGTLLLDEIGEISPAMQVKLLRVLQEREVVPVGDSRAHKTNVRVIAATNRDLDKEVREGRFRQDLLFRVNVISIRIPPLRERREDVAALAPPLLRRYAEESGRPTPRLTREAHDLLMAYRFPGNVRELQNVLHRAVVLGSGDAVGAADLPDFVRDPSAAAEPSAEGLPRGRSLPEFVEEIERRAIRRALAEHGGVRARAARSLGLPERVLRYKLQLYGIDPREPRP
jgi:DNA-binding NtrC family response regulator